MIRLIARPGYLCLQDNDIIGPDCEWFNTFTQATDNIRLREEGRRLGQLLNGPLSMQDAAWVCSITEARALLREQNGYLPATHAEHDDWANLQGRKRKPFEPRKPKMNEAFSKPLPLP